MPSRFAVTQKPIEILLVEDNPGDVRLMREAFREGGFAKRLNVAKDGEQALAFLRRQEPYADAVPPSLVLLDLNLPRKNGREVLAEIKGERSLRHIPVFVVSTSTRQEDIAAAYDLHANCYIPKPLDLEGLIEMGRLIEAFWLRMVVLPGPALAGPNLPGANAAGANLPGTNVQSLPPAKASSRIRPPASRKIS
jgi:two-component system, chemotaxis family, response regulator Rcp1